MKLSLCKGRLPTAGRQRAVLRTGSRTRHASRFPVPVGYRRRNRPAVSCLPVIFSRRGSNNGIMKDDVVMQFWIFGDKLEEEKMSAMLYRPPLGIVKTFESFRRGEYATPT